MAAPPPGSYLARWWCRHGASCADGGGCPRVLTPAVERDAQAVSLPLMVAPLRPTCWRDPLTRETD